MTMGQFDNLAVARKKLKHKRALRQEHAEAPPARRRRVGQFNRRCLRRPAAAALAPVPKRCHYQMYGALVPAPAPEVVPLPALEAPARHREANVFEQRAEWQAAKCQT